jgi:hypothetical protein
MDELKLLKKPGYLAATIALVLGAISLSILCGPSSLIPGLAVATGSWVRGYIYYSNGK